MIHGWNIDFLPDILKDVIMCLQRELHLCPRVCAWDGGPLTQ